MAADVVPKLYGQIQSDFQKNMSLDKRIQTFHAKLENETATAREVFDYVTALGDCASDALCRNLTEENLPDGKLYWNIAERTIRELLLEVHGMVNEAAEQAQRLEDKKNGIGLNPVLPDFPESRVHDLMEKLISILEENDERTIR